MLQGANTHLFNPLVPKAHSSACQKLKLADFYFFFTFGTNGLNSELGTFGIFAFFEIIKLIFCLFYQVKLTGSGLF